MKVLVIGTGQAGTFAAGEISANGHKVVAADIKPDIPFFRRYGPRIDTTVFSLDVLDATALRMALDEHLPDTIVLAFGMNGTATTNPTEQFATVNLQGTANVMRASCESGFVRRVLLISTFAIYGRQAINSLKESTEPSPDTQYGAIKLEAEEQSRKSCVSNALDLRILRPCGIYGPAPSDKGSHSTRLINQLALAAAHNKNITLEWSPSDKDEYLYVQDLARAVALAVDVDDEHGVRCYNIGTGIKTDIADLLGAVRTSWPNFAPSLVEVNSIHEHILPPLDIRRSVDELGFSPKFKLSHGVREVALASGLLH